VSWDQAGGLFVAGTTAYAAVRAVAPKAGETVVVSAAAGGVGSLAVQLSRRTGARVIGIASDANRDWLASVGVEQLAHGDGLGERLKAAAPEGIAAFIDAFGGGYVELAIELGVAPERIDTVIDFAASAKFGTKTDGSMEASEASVLAELAELIAAGELVMEVAAGYPLEQVHAAYTELAKRHTRGKIVLRLR
jgi:NADPH:quinone reductase-like Zn-dependent oxidoreductase